jgi:acetyl esterase/lipase
MVPAGASAASKTPKPPPPPPPPPPHLLLFHGGSFLFDDPTFEGLTGPPALAAGFKVHFVEYPLGDFPAAVRRAREEARRLRDRFGVARVYAYGSSAGGTLAALLSGDGLVSAAVSKAPVSDLLGWEWPLGVYGADYFEQIQAGLITRRQLSPLRRRAVNPLLLIQGRADSVVPQTMNLAFAAKFPRVHLWVVAGGHRTERARPFLVYRAMRWLARIAHRQTVAAIRAQNP